jgi:hypothetical protein
MGGLMDPKTRKLARSQQSGLDAPNDENEGDESNSGVTVTAGPSPIWEHTCRADEAAVDDVSIKSWL